MPGWMCQCLGRGKETEEETSNADGAEEATEGAADATETITAADAVVEASGEDGADPTPEAGDTAGDV